MNSSTRSFCAAMLTSASLLVSVITPTNAQTRNFMLLNRYNVGGSVAEIISTSPDGNTVAFTNSEDKQIGFIDIRSPLAPRSLGTVDVSNLGEPTSVVITPNGRYAIAAIIAEEEKPGILAMISLANRELVAQIELPGIGPDSIAITPDGSKLVVAIEDEEDTDNLPGQRSGSIAIVTLNDADPSQSIVTSVALNLSDIQGVNYVNDVQPEFVAISPTGETAAVTLQENNAIALIDLNSAQVIRVFSAGSASHPADLTEDGRVQLTQPFTGRREPDAIAFTPDGQHLITANEGDTDQESFGDQVWSGGRGWSIFDLAGNVVYDSGNSLETLAAQRGRYPDDRSENRGIEVEGATIAQLNGKPIAFVASERGSFVAAYDVTDVRSPQLMAFLPTGESPEGVIVIPSRNLLLTANEAEGSIDIFRLRPE